MKIKTLFIVGLLFALLITKGYADATVNPSFEGSLVITFPDGRTEIINAGDPVPSIPAGSSIVVMGGKAELTTGPTDEENIKCSCLGADFSLENNTAVKIVCGDKSGSFEVVNGNASIQDKSLQSGDIFPISGDNLRLADATAAGDQVGNSIVGNPEPNSRDIAVSPGQ